MELVSPGGSLEKIETALLYGADAVYAGIETFSLRARQGAMSVSDLCKAADLVHDKDRKIYLAFNSVIPQRLLRNAHTQIDCLRDCGFDAVIVSDLGIASYVQKSMPGMPIHLSTQANCMNTGAARVYKELGVTRIIAPRDLKLEEIAALCEIEGLEIECFAHGSMCVAYSGRCLLSHHMTGRSANMGECAHPCRREFVIAEKQAPDNTYRIEEDGTGTFIMSSKDLCMIEHLDEMRSAGVCAVKIEGRMRSPYYTAVTTRAYRHALDCLENSTEPDMRQILEDLASVSHWPYSTGFYFDRNAGDAALTGIKRHGNAVFAGIAQEGGALPEEFVLHARNKMEKGDVLEVIIPGAMINKQCRVMNIRDLGGTQYSYTPTDRPVILTLDYTVSSGHILRKVLT